MDKATLGATQATIAKQRIYRPELDALRFFAFLSVFLHHTLNVNATGPLMRHPLLSHLLPVVQEGMGFGLCLFFFLSSYLITSLLEVEKQRTGSVHLKKFYVRRVLRIWPLYFVFLAAVYFLGLWWRPAATEPLRLLAFSLLAGNWFSIFFGMGSSVTSHLWSISVEEQFYVVWPSLSRVMPARLLFGFCCGLCVVCLTSTWILAARRDSALSIWLNSMVQSLFFASGALLALHIGIQQQARSALDAALAICGGFMLWFVSAHFAGFADHVHPIVPWRLTAGYAIIAAGCALMLWGFLHVPDRLLPGLLLYLGRISYGLYVFHGLVLVSTRELGARAAAALHLPGILMLAQLLITIGLASLSYEFFEKRFLRLKSRFELVHTRVA
jgi:peptidoglycan/LPS O-acetylase OafA/YrhL